MPPAKAKKPRTKSNNRVKMRASNNLAIEYLLKMGFTDITLRTHCRHKDMVYNKEKKYQATDYWNLFDGMGFDNKQNLIFIQIKTNAFPPAKPMESFCKRYKQKCVAINVRNKKGKRDILIRKYG